MVSQVFMAGQSYKNDHPHATPGVAAGAIFLNARGELLIVKPTYREGWLIPGGMVNDGETPYEACGREVEEELGLRISIGRLLCVGYKTRLPGGRGDGVHFAFDGGRLDDDQIAVIHLPAHELSEFSFVTPDEACRLLAPRLAKRLPECLRALAGGGVAYLENGELAL